MIHMIAATIPENVHAHPTCPVETKASVSYMRVFVDFMLIITHGRFRDCHYELIYLYPLWSYFGSCCSVHLARV